jgi:hypothetical protein
MCSLIQILGKSVELCSYVSWSLLWSVILRSEVIVCFVDIDGLVDQYGLNLHNHISQRTVEYKKDQRFCLLLSLFLTFVLWYVGSGVFRLSLCLLSLTLSLYLVRILYVVVT